MAPFYYTIGTPIVIGGARPLDLGQLFDFRTQKPSAVTYPRLPGAPPQVAFLYTGSATEGTAVVVVSGQWCSFTAGGAGKTVKYVMTHAEGAGVMTDSYAAASAVVRVPTGSVLTAGKLAQVCMSIWDGNAHLRAGLDDDMHFGLFDTEAGGFLGNTIILSLDTSYEIAIKKFGVDYVELWVNGNFVSGVAYSAWGYAGAVLHQVEFGLCSSSDDAGLIAYWTQMGIQTINHFDAWDRISNNGSVAGTSPTHLTDFVLTFLTTDVGKRLDTLRSAVVNGSGGNNNGVWKIKTRVGAHEVELEGFVKPGVILDGLHPKRIIIEGDYEAFTYPDDLGKTIKISGSSRGNNGTYVVQKLLEAGSLVDLSGFSTSMKVQTNVCEVATATFVSELKTLYQLIPAFVTEASIAYRQSDAGFISGDTLTFRQNLDDNNYIITVIVSRVRTGQLLLNSLVRNSVVDPGPPVVYDYYPFFLFDPIGTVRGYLEDLLAAGVFLKFKS